MKVVIIDDEYAMHLILKHILEKVDGVEVIGSFQKTSTAFTFLQNNKVELVFLDINMPEENGLDFARRLRESGWQMKLIFVTSHKEYALPAFDVYAYDYLIKPITKERLQNTIMRAYSELHENKKIEMDFNSNTIFPLVEPLTKREREVLQLISTGMTNRDIADHFKLTEGTIKNHVVRIFEKLQVKNRVQATKIAKENRLIL